MSQSVAADLVRDVLEERIRTQIENLDGRRQRVKDRGAGLASALRQDFAVQTEPAAVKVKPVAVGHRGPGRAAKGAGCPGVLGGAGARRARGSTPRARPRPCR
ncbi:MAG: hypothetical protein JO252_05280 [Planctomycetaceae bacterium]|nr:hypothetical protein [Planctomycetaceae bacterium]